MRAIDVDNLKGIICVACANGVINGLKCIGDSNCALIDVIDKAPTINVQSVTVKQGRWIETSVRGHASICCSECGSESPVCLPLDFCPNCGVYMRGVEYDKS